MTEPTTEPPVRWGEPLDAPETAVEDAVQVLGSQAAAGELLAESAAAARRALRRHLDALARNALTEALDDAAVDRLRTDAAAALHGILARAPEPGAGGEPAPPAREPRYANVADWLHHYLLPNYRRRLLHTRWCRRWWEHAEAISRLEALWQAWEALRYDGATGMAVWWRDYADPHLRVLTAADGPFFDCDATKDKHVVPDQLPVEEPPPGLFRGADHPEERTAG